MSASNFQTVEYDGVEYVSVPPVASRMVDAMSSLSYEFHEAIADLVDNSIGAKASIVKINIEQRIGNRVYVSVVDNGHGIAKNALPAAIQYGGPKNDDEAHLNVYGYGLKTACSSFTDLFYVVSKTSDQAVANAIVFDKKVLRERDDFLFAIGVAEDEFERSLMEVATEGHGTLIVTKDAGRLFTSINQKNDDIQARKMVNRKIENTKRHLRKVFQRFMDFEDPRARNVEIYLNDERLTPWDPFCLAEGVEPAEELELRDLMTSSGRKGTVIMRGYILPDDMEFSSEELAKDAEIGPNTHGVYVYRENRCITLATYFGLFKRETHLSRLRVEFSYDEALDELFHTSLQKDSMVLGDLEERVKDFLIPLKREADKLSRSKSRKKDTTSMHSPSQRRISSVEGELEKASIETIDEKSALVHSQYGELVLPIRSRIDDLNAVPINAVDSLDDGQLWELSLHNGKQVVDINKGHEFYRKVYLPNQKNSLAIQGLDMIMYSLAIIEARSSIPEYRKQFREFRFEVSRTLRQIAEGMPEPKWDEDDY